MHELTNSIEGIIVAACSSGTNKNNSGCDCGGSENYNAKVVVVVVEKIEEEM